MNERWQGRDTGWGVRLFSVLLVLMLVAPAIAQEQLHFIGSDSDRHLEAYLEKKIGRHFLRHTWTYSNAVRQLADWKGGERYLAHMTPYACVAAEMLGANFDVLATYHSRATQKTIYHSFFVVNKRDFEEAAKGQGQAVKQGQPSLNDLASYLESRSRRGLPPAKFLYHDELSTSSFFLPSLYFRDQRVFQITESTGGVQRPILVEKAPPGVGSSFLVTEVASGRVELAAVWDETKEKTLQQHGDSVYFIPLPTDIPNDLLVLSKPLKDEANDPLRDSLLKAIRETADEGNKDWKRELSDQDQFQYSQDEFQYWIDIESEEASDALHALGELRRLAARVPHYVTVDIRWAQDSPRDSKKAQEDIRQEQTEFLRAVQDGVRLSGTEFVPYDPDFHKTMDVTWTLESIHDKAIRLTSQIGEAGLIEPQRFSITFMSLGDLTNRIAALVQTRMHRIRYIWPYQEDYPAVIRDLEFVPEETVRVQRIIWTDQDRNDYEPGVPFDARVVRRDDLHKLRLSEGLFPRGPDGTFLFEPMSNVAYRVILRRPSTEARWLSVMTVILVGLLALAALVCAWDLRRKRPPPTGFVQTYRRLVEAYHEPWRYRQIRESDVLWCDSQKVDALVDRLRSQTPLSEEVQRTKLPWMPVSLGTLHWMYEQALGNPLVKCSEAGSTEALERLIRFLAHGGRLSPFAGRPLEWDALEDIARRNFRRLGIGLAQQDARLNRDAALAALVSRHFQEVLDNGRKVSLFYHRWQLEEGPGAYRLVHREELGGGLRFSLREGEVVSEALLVEFEIPRSNQTAAPEAGGFREILEACGWGAWVLGRIPEGTGPYLSQNGTRAVHVPLEPLAVIKPTATTESRAPVLLKGAA